MTKNVASLKNLALPKINSNNTVDNDSSCRIVIIIPHFKIASDNHRASSLIWPLCDALWTIYDNFIRKIAYSCCFFNRGDTVSRRSPIKGVRPKTVIYQLKVKKKSKLFFEDTVSFELQQNYFKDLRKILLGYNDALKTYGAPSVLLCTEKTVLTPQS